MIGGLKLWCYRVKPRFNFFERFVQVVGNVPRDQDLALAQSPASEAWSEKTTTFVRRGDDNLAVVQDKTGKVLSVLVLGPPEIALGYEK